MNLNKRQLKEIESYLADYQQVSEDNICFGEVSKNNLVSILHYFKTFTIRYIIRSSSMPKMAMVYVLNK